MTSEDRIALPPGIYSILTPETNPRAVVDPTEEGAGLYVSSATGSIAQQWQISGDGVIRSMDSKQYAYVSLPGTENASVTRAVPERQWIINVTKNFDGTWTGWIMTNDCKQCYWGLNGNKVILQQGSPNFWTLEQIQKIYPTSSTGDEIHNAEFLKTKTSTISFINSDDFIPQVFIGIKELNVSTNKSDLYRFRVTTSATDITRSQWVLNFSSRNSFTDFGVGWFKLTQADDRFQCGVYDIPDGHEKSSNVLERITFKIPFKFQPKVMVCTSGFEIGDNWRLRTYATDIDSWGFNLHVENFGSARLYGGRFTWIAFPADRRGVWNGTFTSEYTGKFDGTCSFPRGVFSKAPTIFVALNQFDIDSTKGFNLRVLVSNILTSGMDWSFARGGGIYIAGGAYLAVEL